jgi:23S rRNA (uridine2552-2'-O)-methyltransferase
LDIGCAPGSWIQYIDKVSHPKSKIIWVDLKPTQLNSPKVKTYIQDATDLEKMEKILKENHIEKLDIITSDMAPNTIWVKDIDAIRSIQLVKSTLWIYDKFLKPDGKFIIKVFMWPWFDELVKEIKQKYWAKNIKTFKPQAVRKISKEIYIIKHS